MAVFEYDSWLEEFIETGQFVFEWDRGNRTKNWIRHGIKTEECEEVFGSSARCRWGFKLIRQ